MWRKRAKRQLSIVHIWWIKQEKRSHLSSVPLILIHVNVIYFIHFRSNHCHCLRSKNPLPLHFQTALHRFLGTSPKQQSCHFLVKRGKQWIVLSNNSCYKWKVAITAFSFQLHYFWNVLNSFLKTVLWKIPSNHRYMQWLTKEKIVL